MAPTGDSNAELTRDERRSLAPLYAFEVLAELRAIPGRRWRAFVGVADTLLDRLAEQGYVLVNVEGLAAARGKREFGAYYPPRDDEWAEALHAYLKDDAHSA